MGWAHCKFIGPSPMGLEAGQWFSEGPMGLGAGSSSKHCGLKWAMCWALGHVKPIAHWDSKAHIEAKLL